MKAVLFRGPGRLSIEDLEEPRGHETAGTILDQTLSCQAAAKLGTTPLDSKWIRDMIKTMTGEQETLAEAPRGFEMTSERRDSVLKVALRP